MICAVSVASAEFGQCLDHQLLRYPLLCVGARVLNRTIRNLQDVPEAAAVPVGGLGSTPSARWPTRHEAALAVARADPETLIGARGEAILPRGSPGYRDHQTEGVTG